GVELLIVTTEREKPDWCIDKDRHLASSSLLFVVVLGIELDRAKETQDALLLSRPDVFLECGGNRVFLGLVLPDFMGRSISRSSSARFVAIREPPHIYMCGS